MAVMKDPAFPFYVNDFLASTDVELMELDEIGAYTLLLCRQWKDGSIPAEDAGILKLLGARSARPEIVVSIKKVFPISRDGRRRNERLEKERIKRKRYKEGQKIRGKLGANARWNKGKDGEGIFLPLPKNGLSSSYSSSITFSKDKPPISPLKVTASRKGPDPSVELCRSLTASWQAGTGQNIKPTPGREKQIKTNLALDPEWGDKAKEAVEKVGGIDDSDWPHGKRTFEWFLRMRNFRREWDPVVDKILAGVYDNHSSKKGADGPGWYELLDREKENRA